MEVLALKPLCSLFGLIADRTVVVLINGLIKGGPLEGTPNPLSSKAPLK